MRGSQKRPACVARCAQGALAARIYLPVRAQAQLEEQAARLTELSLQVSKLQARSAPPCCLLQCKLGLPSGVSAPRGAGQASGTAIDVLERRA